MRSPSGAWWSTVRVLCAGGFAALSVSVLAGCPTRGSADPDGDDDTGVEDSFTPPADVRDTGPVMDTGPRRDTGPVMDTGQPEDTGVDVPGDVPVRPPCRPYTPPARTDPCPGRPDCGLSTHGRVTVSGVTAALTDHQVLVTLPAAVRAAAGTACDRLAFRMADNTWAPHFVQDCSAGMVWVRVPRLAPGMTTLTMHYGGTTAVPAANSYDDTFDRVPLRAANMLGAYSFDEGTGSRTCPTVGTTPFDAFVHATPYDAPQTEVATRPPLWSPDAPPSMLNASARFTRGQYSLNFPEHAVLPGGPASPNRLVNWQSAGSAPFNTATAQLTVAVWVYTASPANQYNDNFQTVVCYGMPDLAARAAYWHLPETDPGIENNSIFNPWAIFYRGDSIDGTLYQGNSCVHPCTDVIQYAHISTREPQTQAMLSNRWHFLAFTLDTTARPHTVRRSYYDTRTYEYPRDLDLFPIDGRYCPAVPPAHPEPLIAPCFGDHPTCWTTCAATCPGQDMGVTGSCMWPPEQPIEYPPAPVVIGADMNDGEPQLGLNGKVDDLFIIGRAVPPAEMQAYREHRQYSADPIVVTPVP